MNSDYSVDSHYEHLKLIGECDSCACRFYKWPNLEILDCSEADLGWIGIQAPKIKKILFDGFVLTFDDDNIYVDGKFVAKIEYEPRFDVPEGFEPHKYHFRYHDRSPFYSDGKTIIRSYPKDWFKDYEENEPEYDKRKSGFIGFYFGDDWKVHVKTQNGKIDDIMII